MEEGGREKEKEPLDPFTAVVVCCPTGAPVCVLSNVCDPMVMPFCLWREEGEGERDKISKAR